MNKTNLSALSVALFLGLSASAFAAPMTKGEYNSAKDALGAKFKTEKASCSSMKHNAEDICMEEAKGRDKVAQAELEASYKPSEKHNMDVRLAKADAAYAVAKEKCDDLAGNAKDVCVKEAKAAYVTAKADAKVAEKTADANQTAREKTNEANAVAHDKTKDARKDAASEKRDADYAVAKEKCDALAGDVKAACIKDAKARFGQS